MFEELDEKADAAAMAIQALVASMPEGSDVVVIIADESGCMTSGTGDVPGIVRMANEGFESGNAVSGEDIFKGEGSPEAKPS